MHVTTDLVSTVIGLVGLVVGSWIARTLRTPRDHERAILLAHIADGAAALVLSLTPRATWHDLLKAVVLAIESAAGLPTSNSAAIERAAAGALAKLGKSAA